MSEARPIIACVRCIMLLPFIKSCLAEPRSPHLYNGRRPRVMTRPSNAVTADQPLRHIAQETTRAEKGGKLARDGNFRTRWLDAAIKPILGRIINSSAFARKWSGS